MIKKMYAALRRSVKNIKRKMVISYWSKRARRQVKSCGSSITVTSKSSFTEKTILGNNTNFNGMVIRGGGYVTIGDNFHSGNECMMLTQIHNYDTGESIPYDNTYIVKDITIDDNVWLGSRVMILGGVTIGEGAIIQAGSVVVSDIPACGIAGGHPAKVFKYRDKEHYYKLKKEKKFL